MSTSAQLMVPSASSGTSFLAVGVAMGALTGGSLPPAEREQAGSVRSDTVN